MRVKHGFLLFVVALAGAVFGAGPAVTVLDLPHRVGRLEIDGRLDDWGKSGMVASFADPDPRGNRVTARLAWDRTALFAAFDVVDEDVVFPVPEATGSAIHQWDSVEIYIDAMGDSDTRMDGNDLQLIISVSGAVAGMRGDDLLAGAGWAVPKREARSLAVTAAARRTATGYAVECAIPWPTLGVQQVTAGRTLRLDLACNDWLEDHPQLPEVVIDYDNLERLRASRQNDKSDVQMDDPDHLGWRAGREILERTYLAWSWGGTREFGLPEHWHRVRLAGGPPLHERWADSLGPVGLSGVAAACVAILAGVAMQRSRRRARQRFSVLLSRLEEIEAERAGQEDAASEPAHAVDLDNTSPEGPNREAPVSDSLSGKIDRVQVLVQRGDPVPHELCSRAIAFVIRHLDDPLSPLEVAEGVHVSLRTLQRVLASSLGCAPGELIMAVRMREAQRLLRVEGLLVKEVASRVGFVSVSHFSRKFKEHYRVSPSELGHPGAS